MRVIAESTWSWLLYADGERRWLAVVCGTIGLFERAIELDAEECARIAADPDQIEQLARAVGDNPAHYHDRYCSEALDSDAARLATAAWRAAPEKR